MRSLMLSTVVPLVLAACSAPQREGTALAAATRSGSDLPVDVRRVASNGVVDERLGTDSRTAATSGELAAADTALLRKGKEIVSTICAACHTEQPPPKLAPPLAHVSQRYRMMVGDRDKAIARITAWIKEPSKDRSLMPPMAIERFGLMAPLPLPDDQRLAAATYLWSLSEGKGGMQGMQGMQGVPGMQGMKGMPNMPGMQHGARDSTKLKDTTDTIRR